MKTAISRKLVHMAAKSNHPFYDGSYTDVVVNAYLSRVDLDNVFFGESLMRELPQKAVAVVSSPLTAILCTMDYLQVWEGAEVPVWVAVNGDKLNETHISGLNGRDCYFYPTATQYWQWVDCVSRNREILGNVAYVHDGLFLSYRHCPNVIREDSDLSSVVTLPFELSSLFMAYDMTEFYQALDLLEKNKNTCMR